MRPLKDWLKHIKNALSLTEGAAATDRTSNPDTPATPRTRPLPPRHFRRTPPPVEHDTHTTLRMDLFNQYTAAIDHQPFTGSLDSSQALQPQFATLVEKWMRIANQAYADRSDRSGIWYAKDYIKQHGRDYATKDATTRSISFFSNPKFWNVGITTRFEEENGQHSPSELLDAFFQGPTMAECGSVLQACLYRAIEELIGTAAFNQTFHKALTPFRITGNLLAGMHSKEDWASQGKQREPEDWCNPLYFLFQSKAFTQQASSAAPLTDSDIQPGDIIYLQGVIHYSDKHLFDSAPGWNLLCVGKNAEGHNLYSGFAPGNFEKPKTYADMKKMLIDGYNRAQSRDTQLIIQQQPDKPESKKAAALAHDTVADDHPIGGITAVLSLSPAKFAHYITQRADSLATPWHVTDEPALPLFRSQPAQRVRTAIPFTAENTTKDFSNYREETPMQRSMAEVARKFAKAVVMRPDKKTIGLVMTGLPGIGKTHLSVAIAKLAAELGADVLFADSHSIGATYQHHAEQHGFQAMSEEQLEAMLRDWIGSADLIVFDDINSEFGCGDTFLKIAMDYCLKHNKALALSSNEPINLTKHLRTYIGYDDDAADNFLVMRDLQGRSYRQCWWQTLIDSKKIADLSSAAKIKLLAQHKTGSPAAIALEDKAIDLAAIKRHFQRASGLTPAKIKIVGAPYRTSGVHSGKVTADFYNHDADQYDAFIIQANTHGECSQLINLVIKVHDLGKQLIVVSNDIAQTKQHIAYCIRYSHTSETKRLTDRIAHLFLQDMLPPHKEKHALVRMQDTAAQALAVANPAAGPLRALHQQEERLPGTLTFFLGSGELNDHLSYTFRVQVCGNPPPPPRASIDTSATPLLAAANTQLVLFRNPAQPRRPQVEQQADKEELPATPSASTVASHSQLVLFRNPAQAERRRIEKKTVKKSHKCRRI